MTDDVAPRAQRIGQGGRGQPSTMVDAHLELFADVAGMAHDDALIDNQPDERDGTSTLAAGACADPAGRNQPPAAKCGTGSVER